MSKSNRLAMTLVAALAWAMLMPDAKAQSPNGITAGKPTIGLSYYKVSPGKHDEWLHLFRLWHYPLIQEMIREGVINDFKLLLPNVHGRDAGWDFVGMTVGATTRPTVQVGTAERIRKVFPDIDAFEKGEKARWALTIDHWDELTAEIDLAAEPLSVYRPVELPTAQ